MSKVFPFTLKDVFIPNILFRLNPSFEPEKEKIELDTTIEINYSNQRKKLSVQVKVELMDGEKMPFSFVVEGVGLFEFKEKPPAEDLEKLARINCAAIIFPYVREAVADLTRRAGVPPLHLRPVNFVELMKISRLEEKVSASKNKKKVVKK